MRLVCLLLILAGVLTAQKGPVRVQVTPQNPTIVAGSPNVQLVAREIFFTDLGKQPTGPALTATWSSNMAVATVSASGLVTGKATGSAVITAASGPFQGSTSVAVDCSHFNGVGQNYDDCADALGTPGSGSSYNLTMASKAAAAWAAGTTSVVACGGSSAVADQHVGMCGVWAYSGALAGHVSLAGACVCPISGSPTWN